VSGVTNAQPTAASIAPDAMTDVPSQVVDQLSEAWCEMDLSCDRVGTSRQYVEECRGEVLCVM
jgi:hypothetical protein